MGSVKRAIILAAGRGTRLSGVFDEPKCLVRVKDSCLLGRALEMLSAYGVAEIVLVTGYREERIREYVEGLAPALRVHLLVNKRYDAGSILSLWTARDWLRGDVLLMDGDLYFEEEFLSRAFRSEKQDFFLVDSGAVNDGEAVMVGFRNGRAVELGRGLRGDFDLIGEWAGVLKLCPEGADSLCQVAAGEVACGRTQGGYEFVVPRLFDDRTLSFELVDGCSWTEIDYPGDLDRANRMANHEGVEKRS